MCIPQKNLVVLRSGSLLPGQDVKIGVPGQLLYLHENVFLVSKDEVCETLLLKRVYQYFCGHGLWEFFSSLFSLSSNIVPLFRVDIDNDVDIALYAPVLVLRIKTKCYTILHNVYSWNLFNQIKIRIQGKIHFYSRKFMFGLHFYFDWVDCLLINSLWNVVSNKLGRIRVKSELSPILIL
jgi:hypothetical protein